MVKAQAQRSGFTLVELMVTLAVIAVLATIAIPNLNSFLASSRLSAVVSDLTSSIAQARSEAIKRGSTITLRALGGAGFEGGWEVFTDSTCPTGSKPSGATVVASQAAYASDISTTMVPALAPMWISFSSTGSSVGLNCAAGAGTITLAVANSSSSGQLTLAWGGRVKYTKL